MKLQLLLDAAKAGDATAQFQIAHLFQQGDPIEKDLTESIFWFTKSFEGGNTDAGYRLGLIYCFEDGFKNTQLANYYFEKVAANNSEAAYNLAVNYYTGHGGAVDMDAAKKWFLVAEKGGYAVATHMLSTIK